MAVIHFFLAGNRLFSAPAPGIVVRDRSEFANISKMLDVRTGKLKKVKSILPVFRTIILDSDFFFIFDVSFCLVKRFMSNQNVEFNFILFLINVNKS